MGEKNMNTIKLRKISSHKKNPADLQSTVRQMFHSLKVICPNFVQTGIPPDVYDEIKFVIS